ncbi:MAG: hypothetical protein QW803_13265 [Candidatus Methanomethylicia archaeon]
MKARISDFIVVKFKYSRFIELILHFIILLIPLSWIYLISRFKLCGLIIVVCLPLCFGVRFMFIGL